jgi:hypothetical protein
MWCSVFTIRAQCSLCLGARNMPRCMHVFVNSRCFVCACRYRRACSFVELGKHANKHAQSAIPHTLSHVCYFTRAACPLTQAFEHFCGWSVRSEGGGCVCTVLDACAQVGCVNASVSECCARHGMVRVTSNLWSVCGAHARTWQCAGSSVGAVCAF